MRQGAETSASFAALLGELQFAPRDASLGARPFKSSDDDPDLFTAPFEGGLLLYRVDDERRVIRLGQVIWNF